MTTKRNISLLILTIEILGGLLLGACASSATNQESSDQQDLPVVTIYKSPT